MVEVGRCVVKGVGEWNDGIETARERVRRVGEIVESVYRFVRGDVYCGSDGIEEEKFRVVFVF